ncbi:MAG: hypothetical protein JWM76_2127 [Pseudonocardiales bacterium]|nr:hypothetical protein [Pseudonocardiales bacterium]
MSRGDNKSLVFIAGAITVFDIAELSAIAPPISAGEFLHRADTAM